MAATVHNPGVTRTARTPVLVYAAFVLLNYAAQVPYALDLYGLAFNLLGVLLVGATLAWFAIGFALLWWHRAPGYWILLAYVIAQIIFYVRTDILGSFTGGGLPFQLFHARDAVVWLAFLAGDLNFVAAIGTLIYLLRRRSELLG